MSIDLGSCAVRETIVVTTRASVYELIVLRGDEGDIFVPRRRALYCGHACTISRFDCRRRLGENPHHRYRSPHEFVCVDRFVITSPSSPSPAAAQRPPHWSAYQSSEVGVPRESRSSLTLADAGGRDRDPPQAALFPTRVESNVNTPFFERAPGASPSGAALPHQFVKVARVRIAGVRCQWRLR